MGKDQKVYIHSCEPTTPATGILKRLGFEYIGKRALVYRWGVSHIKWDGLQFILKISKANISILWHVLFLGGVLRIPRKNDPTHDTLDVASDAPQRAWGFSYTPAPNHLVNISLGDHSVAFVPFWARSVMDKEILLKDHTWRPVTRMIAVDEPADDVYVERHPYAALDANGNVGSIPAVFTVTRHRRCYRWLPPRLRKLFSWRYSVAVNIRTEDEYYYETTIPLRPGITVKDAYHDGLLFPPLAFLDD